MPDGAKETRVDRILKALKNHSLLSVLIVAGVVVIALANFTSAWQTLRSFVSEMRGEPTKSALIAEYCNLVAPLVAQLDRTEKAIKERWTEGNEALERSTIRDANLKARELLTRHAGLVPTELEGHRQDLVNHYDEWLEKFYLNREQRQSDSQEPYTFVFSFPRDSEAGFRERYKYLRGNLGPSVDCD